MSPLLVAQWIINDGEYLPSPTFCVPTSAGGMVAEAADAYWVCCLTPKLFTRKHCYVLFFSGGYNGRTTTSYELWDYMDREFEDMTVDEAKVCSHNRLQVQGAMDLSRERDARDLAAYRTSETDGAVRYAVAADSDEEEPAIPNTSRSRGYPPPSAITARDTLSQLGRTSSDTSAASENLPLICHPKCVQAGCTRAGTFGMISCDICEGSLHRSCGTLVDEDDEECTDRVCATCASPGKGKGRAIAY